MITGWPAFEFMTFDIEGKTLTMTSYQVNNLQGIPSPGNIECSTPTGGNADGAYVPSCPSYTVPSASITPIETVVLNHFTNVSPQVSVTGSGLLYNRATKTYNGTITVTNNGSALTGNVDVVLDGILDLQNVNTNVLNTPSATAANGIPLS